VRRIFSTFLVDEAVERRKKAAEEVRLALLERALAALKGLSQRIPFSKAYVFGSLARPGAFMQEISDADIAFEGLRIEDFFRTAAFLSAELGLDVDVVRLEDVAGSLLEAKIKREGILWTPER